MGRSRNMARLALPDTGLIPAASLAPGAAVTNLGFTPLNRQGGDTRTGVQDHNGWYTATNVTGGQGAVNKRFKIARIASHFWGEGGVIVEVMRRQYAEFGYAKYRIYGHTANAHGPGMNITQLMVSGTVPSMSLSGIVLVDPAQYGWGYVDLYADEVAYAGSIIKISSGLPMYSEGSAIGANRIVMYPNFTYA